MLLKTSSLNLNNSHYLNRNKIQISFSAEDYLDNMSFILNGLNVYSSMNIMADKR